MLGTDLIAETETFVFIGGERPLREGLGEPAESVCQPRNPVLAPLALDRLPHRLLGGTARLFHLTRDRVGIQPRQDRHGEQGRHRNLGADPEEPGEPADVRTPADARRRTDQHGVHRAERPEDPGAQPHEPERGGVDRAPAEADDQPDDTASQRPETARDEERRRRGEEIREVDPEKRNVF